MFGLIHVSSQLKQFKNLHKGKRCFIVGNGPSLRKHDLGFLRSEHVFACNWIVLHPHFFSFKNLNYFVADPYSFANGTLTSQILEKIRQHPDCRIFFHQTGTMTKQAHIKDKNFYDRIHMLRLNTDKKVWEGHFHSDITKPLCWGWTTLIDLCLPVALYMGFEQIYFIGCDADYYLEKAGHMFEAYFYNVSELPETEIEILKSQPEELIREAVDYTLKSYAVISDVLKNSHVKVFNASEGGKLNVFERVSFNDLF